MVTWIVVPIALLGVFLPACGGDDGGGSDSASQDPAALEGKAWVLTQYLGADGSTVIADEGVSATFADGQVSGPSGCNTYNASYEASGTTISFGPIASTQMACGDDAMALEAQYLKLLGEATTYEISGRSMSMSNADGTPTLQFSQG
jgi:heat shock protein HslJ